MEGEDIALGLSRAVLNPAGARDNQIGSEPDEQAMLDDARTLGQRVRQLSSIRDGAEVTVQDHVT